MVIVNQKFHPGAFCPPEFIYIFSCSGHGSSTGPHKGERIQKLFHFAATFVKSNECCQRPLRLPAGVPRRCNGPLIGPPQ